MPMPSEPIPPKLRSALDFQFLDALGQSVPPVDDTDIYDNVRVKINLDSDALALASVASVIVFPLRWKSPDGSLVPVSQYELDATVELPEGAVCRWRAEAAYSVRIACKDPLAIRLGQGVQASSLSFENLLFTGCGVGLEGTCTAGVLFLSCGFVGVKREFAIRGALSGRSGPNRVRIRQCTFEECGVDKNTALTSPVSPPSDPFAQIAWDSGSGAVWMPGTARNWAIEHCGFVGYRGVPLRLHGSECTVTDSDFESPASSLELGHEVIEIRSQESVILSRLRFGNEGTVPNNLVKIIPPGVWPLSPMGQTVPAAPAESVVVHGIHAQSVPDAPPRSGTTAIVDVQAPVRGLRILDLTVGNGFRGAVRLTEPRLVRAPGTGTPADASPQNAACRIGTGADNDGAVWFIGADVIASQDLPESQDTAPVVLGQSFDIAGEWARTRLFRADDATRASQNWLRDTDVRPGAVPWRPESWITPLAGLIPGAVTGAVGPWPLIPAARIARSPAWIGSDALVWFILGQTVHVPKPSKGTVSPSRIVCLSVWAWVPAEMTIELQIRRAEVLLASERFPGQAADRRYFIVATEPGGPDTELSIQISVIGPAPATQPNVAWLAWPQLEAGARPTPYRRGPPALANAPGSASPVWPAEAWAIGPLGIAEGCPSAAAATEHAAGDRLVGTVSGAENARTVSWMKSGGAYWRTAVAVATADGLTRQWLPSGGVDQKES